MVTSFPFPCTNPHPTPIPIPLHSKLLSLLYFLVVLLLACSVTHLDPVDSRAMRPDEPLMDRM